MEYKDYYKIMGVGREASQDEIKRAYRRLARKFHPDVSKEANAEDRFKEVGEAYEVLSDPEKRSAYDGLGPDWQAGQQFRPPPDWDGSFRHGGPGDERDFRSTSSFSDFFETLFGAGTFQGGGRQFQAAGEDLRVNVPLTLEEAYSGTTRELNLTMPEVDSAGRAQQRARTLRVKMPQGVTDGQRIRLPGQGGSGVGGGPRGDLFAIVQIVAHPHFRHDGRDIYLDLPVTPWEAALGVTVKVPTLGGTVDLKIPKGSLAGQRLRLKGRGLPGKPPGDQMVILQIVAPPADSPEAEALYRRMAELMPTNPRASLGV